MTPQQRNIFFQLGAEIGNTSARRMGYPPDVNRAHAYAVWACEMANWKSYKAAKAFFITAQPPGHL